MPTTYYPADENPMFSPELTVLLRFVRPTKAMKCPECGKKTKRLWTLLCPFRATSLQGFSTQAGDLREAGTPVCENHPLAPAIAPELIECGTVEEKERT